MYYTYMLRCADNSIYTGITTDLNRRLEEHLGQDKKCAKYTLTHNAQKLEIAWESESRVLASKLEYHIKKTLTKPQKEELILKNNINQLLGEKVDASEYRKISLKMFT